ncbi:hypothetical protein D3C72_2321190 [compost metagenome]
MPASDTPAIRPPLFITKPTMGCCAVLVSMRPLAPMLTTATVASAPTVQPLLARNLARDSSVMNRRIIAFDWAPAWKPIEPAVVL